MKNLFSSLYKLKLNSSERPVEDFLTEVFAFCLQTHPELLIDLLKKLKIDVNGIGSYYVKTQVVFKKLKNHKTDSIPDIVIYLEDFILFIESKIDSEEGESQLKRYAEQIDVRFKNGMLLYLTKNFDLKKEERILENVDRKNVRFKRLRWFDVFQIANRSKDNLLIRQMLGFMENSKISSNNQFSPLDILTLSNFSKVRLLMDETMSGEVSEKFEKVVGGTLKKKSTSMTQLRDKRRYIYSISKRNKTWVGLGYWLNPSNEEDDYPEVRFVVEVSPKSSKYREVKKKMLKVLEEDNKDWKSYNLENPESWAGIFLSRSLRAFMPEEDHVERIRDFFLSSIDEYGKLKDHFGDLI